MTMSDSMKNSITNSSSYSKDNDLTFTWFSNFISFVVIKRQTFLTVIAIGISFTVTFTNILNETNIKPSLNCNSNN